MPLMEAMQSDRFLRVSLVSTWPRKTLAKTTGLRLIRVYIEGQCFNIGRRFFSVSVNVVCIPIYRSRHHQCHMCGLVI
jgi:hypothetical protein